jgi:hypothetical protein
MKKTLLYILRSKLGRNLFKQILHDFFNRLTLRIILNRSFNQTTKNNLVDSLYAMKDEEIDRFLNEYL